MMTMAELKALPQWVGYNDEKIPVSPHTGRWASVSKPEDWATAEEAWKARGRFRLPGISFVFTLESGVVGVDLDKCINADGQLSDTARQVVALLNSYTEYSPSGRGLHILALGTIPRAVKTAGLEMYSRGRAFTVTGKVYGEHHLIEDRNAEIEALFVTFAPELPEPEPYEPGRPIPNRYAEKAVLSAMKVVSTAVNGSRNNTLYGETASLVELVNAGACERGDVERAMTAAAVASGLAPDEAAKTIASAFAKVKKARVLPPPKPRYTARIDVV